MPAWTLTGRGYDEAAMGRAVILPSVLLGIGLGAMVDVIVFHQILQWHHLASSRIPMDTLDGLQANVRLDALFMAGTWVLTVVALLLLWRTAGRLGARPPGRVVVGAALAGWGGFNVYDGLVDHHVVQLHHTTHGPDAAFWDVVIIAWGAAFLVGGWLLVRRGRDEAGTPAIETP